MADPLSQAEYLATRGAQQAQGWLNKVPGFLARSARQIFPVGTGVQTRGELNRTIARNLGGKAISSLVGANPYGRVIKIALQNEQARKLIIGFSVGTLILLLCTVFFSMGVLFNVIEFFSNSPLTKIEEYVTNSNNGREFTSDLKLQNCQDSKERLKVNIDCSAFAQEEDI